MFYLKKSPLQQSKYHDCNASIVAKCTLGGQLYSFFCHIIGKFLSLENLICAIEAKQLTEALEILEDSGFSEELAVFILDNFQSLGGVA